MTKPLTATLQVSCPDQKGLVSGISGFLAQHDANIVSFHEYVGAGEERDTFFARVVFQLGGLAIAPDEVAPAFAPLARRFEMAWSLFMSDRPKRMGILVSKFDHCLYDLLIRHKAGELPLEVPLVISNHDDLRHVADFFGVPYYHCPIGPGGKGAQEAAMLELLSGSGVDFVVMARYMQVLSSEFLAAYPHRVINIHHSFLPAFAGGKPYHQAYDRGVKLIGATAHYATEDLDEGPIIEQDVVRVHHSEDPSELVRKGRDIERVVLARAVRLHAENRILVHGRRTVVFA